MKSLSVNPTIWRLVFVSAVLVRFVFAADGCYLKNSDSGIQVALAQYPCSSNGGVQVCCNIGDTCGEDSICRRNSAYTLPAALTSTSTIRASSTTHTTTLATVVSTTSMSLSRVTSSAPTSSTTPRPTSSPVYPISSVAELLSSLSFPSDINLIPRQIVANQSFYVGGCTDSSYNSSECSNHCTGYSMQNIVYNSSTGSWSCCGDTLAGCSAPTRETFDAIPPSAFDAVAPVPPSVASTLASSVISSATNTNSSPSSHSSGLGSGASAGIAFGVIIPVIFTLAASIGFCLRKRKVRARRRAQIDRALSEELAGRMRSLDSWYEGPLMRPSRPILHISTPSSRGVSVPGHTFAYETPEGMRHVKLKEQTAAVKRMPLQLQLAKLHFGLGPRRGRNALNRNQSGMLVSPQDMATSPVRRRGGLGLFPLHGFEEMEDGTIKSGTWPIPPSLPRPWEFQQSVVSLREMDGTGINPLEQRQSDGSDSSSETADGSYEDVVMNSISTDGEWQVQQPWQIQKPPSLREMDGTARLSFPAW